MPGSKRRLGVWVFAGLLVIVVGAYLWWYSPNQMAIRTLAAVDETSFKPYYPEISCSELDPVRRSGQSVTDIGCTVPTVCGGRFGIALSNMGGMMPNYVVDKMELRGKLYSECPQMITDPRARAVIQRQLDEEKEGEVGVLRLPARPE